MRTIIFTLVSISLITFAGFYYQEDLEDVYNKIAYFSFCEQPITFRVDAIDTQFNVNRKTVKNNTIEAAEIWNKALNQKLFVYDETSDLDIDLVFDERQRSMNQISNREQKLEVNKISLNEQVENYENEYDKLTKYVNDLNSQIEYWNQRGGAPPEIYNELVKQQKNLNNAIEELNETANEINTTTSLVNLRIGELNTSIYNFNEVLNTLPEEGLYTSDNENIQIFFYDSKDRFVHTVAHELGHALGLNHVINEGAIMHPTTSASVSLQENDLVELKNFCREQSRFEHIKNNFELILRDYINENSFLSEQ